MIVNRDELIFIDRSQEKESEEDIVLIDHFDFSENQSNINLVDHIESIDGINKGFEWDFDAEKLHFPLRLRKQKEGDEFYPTGFSGKRKFLNFLGTKNYLF
ncbi:hypothetical protein OWR28_04505 [Chryseobacterium sp. 1B4]